MTRNILGQTAKTTAARVAQGWAAVVAMTAVACGGQIDGVNASTDELTSADAVGTTTEALSLGCALVRDFPSVDVAPYGQTCAGATEAAALRYYGLSSLAEGALDEAQLVETDRVIRALDATLRTAGAAGGVAQAFPKVTVVRAGAELATSAPAWHAIRNVPQLATLASRCASQGAEALTLARLDAPGAVLAVCPGAHAPYGAGLGDTLVHELGHVLDATLGDEGSAALANALGPAAGSQASCPVSHYAETNAREDFAETFLAYAGTRGSAASPRAVVDRRLAFFDTVLACAGAKGCAASVGTSFASGNGPALPEACPAGTVGGGVEGTTN